MDVVYQIKERLKIDTPIITNLVATYPGHEYCLKIYNPWEHHWYTKNTLLGWYLDLGTRAGRTLLNTFGLKDKLAKKGSFIDVLDGMALVLLEEGENHATITEC